MYDPMVAKLIVWDADREQATRRMVRALREFEIGGLTTLLPFHEAILQTRQWADAETCRDLIEDRAWLATTAGAPAAAAPTDSPEAAETQTQEYTVEVSGKRFDVRVIAPVGALAGGSSAGRGIGSHPPSRPAPRRGARAENNGHGHNGGDDLTSPLQGTVLKVSVEPGAHVEAGALVCVIEAMKMENEITAHKAGTITQLAVAPGAAVSSGEILAVISSNGASAE
jgi:acetyl-CoA/propionyl-CoA carboxylase biotin carboxyl carrier protein